MSSAKDFLVQECLNVKSLLDQTLRNEYGGDGSRDFYDECATRLEFIESEIAAAVDDRMLQQCMFHLNELSKLICRIERSSLGEYSWPFVDKLKDIATAICTELTLTAVRPPKIFVLADGGLDSYAIFAEQRRPSASERLLLTIVFPKSLKQFVLLHAILGHEIGHAIWRCSKHQGELIAKVMTELRKAGGIFANSTATLDHLYSSTAPADAKSFLNILDARLNVGKSNFWDRWGDWDAWIEEILCDLIGVAIFGPAFAAAECDLLYALDPSGMQAGKAHPPVAWRVNMIVRVCNILGHDTLPLPTNAHYDHIKRFWEWARSFSKPDPWCTVFQDSQLDAALNALMSLFDQYPPTSYPKPDLGLVGQLVAMIRSGVPPVGFSILRNGNPRCQSIDFRHILYSGWIASRGSSDMKFEYVNKLCEHGIMQQCGIDIHVAGSLKGHR